jgi:hypothetical protein
MEGKYGLKIMLMEKELHLALAYQPLMNDNKPFAFVK